MTDLLCDYQSLSVHVNYLAGPSKSINQKKYFYRTANPPKICSVSCKYYTLCFGIEPVTICSIGRCSDQHRNNSFNMTA